MTWGGACRNSCEKEIIKEYGPNSKPRQCTCKDLPIPGDMHVCTCCIVCKYVKDKNVFPAAFQVNANLNYTCNNI